MERLKDLPKLPSIAGIKESISQANLLKRVIELEEWSKRFADPTIKANIAQLESRYNEIMDIYNRMKNASITFENEVKKMTEPISRTIKNANWLATDYKEINHAIRGYWIPNVVAAAIHTIEAVAHTVGMGMGIRDTLIGLKDRLFPALSNVFKIK